MPFEGTWFLLARIVACGYVLGLAAGAVCWSLLADPMPLGGSGNGRHRYMWGFVGGLMGVAAGLLVAVAVHRRSLLSRTRNSSDPYLGDHGPGGIWQSIQRESSIRVGCNTW